MVLSNFRQHFECGLLFIDLGRCFLEPLLIAMQVRVTDLSQTDERDVDHLFVKQLLAKGVCSQTEVALRYRQKFRLEKRLVSLQSGDNLLRALAKLGQ